MTERVGFVGLGLMGRPMARNLLAAGFPLTVHSRSPGPVEDLASAVATRLRGMTPTAFVALRRSEASASMLQAQGHRVRGETAEAIRAALQTA